jgi:hypothetical protein
MRRILLWAAVGLGGCGNNQPVAQKPTAPAGGPANNAPAKPKGGGGVIGEYTRHITEYLPNEPGWRPAKTDFEYTDPITGPLAAYGPTMGKISGMTVKMRVDAYQALHGHYPRDFAEFKREVFDAKGEEMKLPALPGGREYRYDVANHKVVVVEPDK